jgi:methyl-accepting chemotaxis protein
MKLQGKILLPIIGLIVVMMGLSSFLSYREAAANLRTALRGKMQGEAEAAMRATSELIRNSRLNVQRTAAMDEVRALLATRPDDPNAREHVGRLLHDLLASYPDFATINVVAPGGLVIASSDPTLTGRINIGDRGYVAKALAGEAALSPPFFGEHTGTTRFVASAPVRDGSRVLGAVTGAISLEHYFETSIDPIRVGDKGCAYVLDTEGPVLAARNKDWLFNKNLPTSPVYRELVRKTEGGMIETMGNDGEPVVLYYVKEPLAGMTLVVRAEKDDVFSGLAAIMESSVTMAILSSLLGALLVFVIVRPVVRAINRSVDFAGASRRATWRAPWTAGAPTNWAPWPGPWAPSPGRSRTSWAPMRPWKRRSRTAASTPRATQAGSPATSPPSSRAPMPSWAASARSSTTCPRR